MAPRRAPAVERPAGSGVKIDSVLSAQLLPARSRSAAWAFLHDRRDSTKAGDKGRVRLDLWDFGAVRRTWPPMCWAVPVTCTRPVSGSRSCHRRANASPILSPVETSSSSGCRGWLSPAASPGRSWCVVRYCPPRRVHRGAAHVCADVPADQPVAGGGAQPEQEHREAHAPGLKLNPQTISQKAAIVVEHFRENVAHLLDGHAKAMVVTDSRKAAVRYKLAIDKYIAAKGYGYGTLVAFSGSVQDPESGPDDFTESSMNPGVHDLRNAFKGDEFKVMIVPTSSRPASTSRCCARCTSTACSPGSPRCRPCPGSTAPTSPPPVCARTSTPPRSWTSSTSRTSSGSRSSRTSPMRSWRPQPTRNLVHDVITKLDQAGIYTPAEVDQCAEAFVKGKGNNALTAAVNPGKKRFQERYTSALIDNGGQGDNAALDELDTFRKDVGTFVRLYDFMSQIIVYGDPDLEKKSIYLRLLERVIQPNIYTAPLDLSDVVLVAVKQIDKGKSDIGLGKPVGLVGATAAGSGAKKDPKMVAFAAVLERLNDLFGNEDFTEDQKVSFLEALLRTLLADDSLVQQARGNSPKHLTESPDFDDAVWVPSRITRAHTTRWPTTSSPMRPGARNW